MINETTKQALVGAVALALLAGTLLAQSATGEWKTAAADAALAAQLDPPTCPAWARVAAPEWVRPFQGPAGAPETFRAKSGFYASGVAGIDRYQANNFIWHRPETAEFYADGRWVMADATNLFVGRDADGKLLSAAECHDGGAGQRHNAESKVRQMRDMATWPHARLGFPDEASAAAWRVEAVKLQVDELAVRIYAILGYADAIRCTGDHVVLEPMNGVASRTEQPTLPGIL